MSSLFADTGYWAAILNPKDDLHDRALRISERLDKRRIVTTEMVLDELLRLFAKPPLRMTAAATVDGILTDANVDVIPQTGLQFRDAFSLFKKRQDKSWSLTDCSSFILMSERGIQEALAHDQHFEQAGFVALLRGDR